MDRTADAWEAIGWRPLRLAAITAGVLLLALDLTLVIRQVPFTLFSPRAGVDFFGSLASSARGANPYEGTGYVWSPLATIPLDFITPLGFRVWQLLIASSLLLVRPWWVTGAVALSYPFWFDIGSGNVVTLMFAVTWVALSGGRVATYAFFVLALLMPRPLLLPALVWILWQRPATRFPFVLLFVANALGVLATGWGDEWFRTLVSHGPHQIGVNPWNISPSAWLGVVWVPIGLALAAVLTRRGHLGLASLTVSPYLMHNYLLFALLQLRPRDPLIGTVGDPAKRDELAVRAELSNA